MINNHELFFNTVFNNENNKHILLMGDTIDPNKFANKILKLLESKKYLVYCVDKQYKQIIDIDAEIQVVILCMHPIKSFELLKNNTDYLKNVIIQPGAESDDIINLLKNKNINYTLGCVLKYFKVS